MEITKMIKETKYPLVKARRKRRKKYIQSGKCKQAIAFQVAGQNRIKFISSNKIREDGLVQLPKKFMAIIESKKLLHKGTTPVICWYYDRKNRRGIFGIDAVIEQEEVVHDENGTRFEKII